MTIALTHENDVHLTVKVCIILKKMYYQASSKDDIALLTESSVNSTVYGTNATTQRSTRSPPSTIVCTYLLTKKWFKILCNYSSLMCRIARFIIYPRPVQQLGHNAKGISIISSFTSAPCTPKIPRIRQGWDRRRPLQPLCLAMRIHCNVPWL